MKTLHNLKSHRIQQQLTQEDLAALSGISIRTIQRIEKGLSSGSPHSVKALAHALQIDSKELSTPVEQSATESPESLNIVKLMNFSILSVLILPFGNLIVPGLIYFSNKSNEHMRSIGKRILGFQALSTAVLFYITVLIFLGVDRGRGAIPLPVITSYLIYASISMLVVFKTHFHLDKEQTAPPFFPSFI